MGNGIEAAIQLALSAHAGQTDKAGAPYILHPLRVMLAGATAEERIVGVLHDVVEDSDVELDVIRESFGAQIADAVDAMTKRRGETYSDFIQRCAENPLARRVKQNDLADNMNVGRLGRDLTEDDEVRLRKYADACAVLVRVESGA
jgi:(p)ppGpp synthase/HD superfamily hydrolase